MITLRVNGRTQTVDVDPATPLLYVLSDELAMNGPKFGCGLGQCGACTVIVDGAAVQSCDVPVSAVEGKAIVTIEGIGTADRPHPLQAAFVKAQAAQCGYCATGIIMTAKALLDRNPKPGDAEIREALAGNLCRCGTHARILQAIRSVVQGDAR